MTSTDDETFMKIDLNQKSLTDNGLSEGLIIHKPDIKDDLC